MRNCAICFIILFAVAGTAHSETPIQPRELAVDLGKSVKLEMSLIPVGVFLMGSPDSDNDPVREAKPQHRVRITKPFYLGKHEVTQEQWKVVKGSNPSYVNSSTHPVERVSWEDCQRFLDKLNGRQGNPKGKFQLPTEAQWEYACRAGSTKKHCFGDDVSQLGDYAWYDTNSGRRTHPVGRKKPNAFGLYDMHGNVGEWCQDWWHEDYYAKSPTADPTGPTTGTAHVRRGGSAYLSAEGCCSANRMYLLPGDSDLDLGFRICFVPAE
ncbi:MAG: formylglycine-generating enzyme family protein [Planctomycetota bacterium]